MLKKLLFCEFKQDLETNLKVEIIEFIIMILLKP